MRIMPIESKNFRSMSKSRYLFSYAPSGVDASTSFYWVFLSDKGRDAQFCKRLAAICRNCPDFLFVKYDARWHDFVGQLFHHYHAHALMSFSHSIIKIVSPGFIRRLVDDFISANSPHVKNLSQLFAV